MRTIMIVEDSPMCALIAERIYGAAGCAVVGKARTMEAALQLYASAHPELVSLDIQLMGSADGMTIIEGLRAYDPAVKVVFFSSRSELQPEMRASGALGYIDKGCINGSADRTVIADVHSILEYAACRRPPQEVRRTKYRVLLESGFATMVRPPEGGK